MAKEKRGEVWFRYLVGQAINSLRTHRHAATWHSVPGVPGTWCSADLQTARFRRQRHCNVQTTDNSLVEYTCPLDLQQCSKSHLDCHRMVGNHVQWTVCGNNKLAESSNSGEHQQTPSKQASTEARKHQFGTVFLFLPAGDIPHPAAPPHLPNRPREELQHPTPYGASKALRYSLGHPHGTQATCIATLPTNPCRCSAS